MKNNYLSLSLPKPKNDKQYGIAALSFICVLGLKPLMRITPLVAIAWLLLSSTLIFKLSKTESEPLSRKEIAREAKELEQAALASLRGDKRRKWLAS